MIYYITTHMLVSVLFAKAYGGTSGDEAYSIVQTTDGGYAVAAYTYSFGAGSYDFLVLKLNSSGGLDWARTFGGTDWDWAYSMVQTTDGGYAVAGYTGSFGAGDYDFLVLKLNSSGGLEWARTFGGTGWDGAYSMVQTTDGGFAVAGRTESFGAGGYDLLVLKLNSSGDLQWARTFGGTDWDWAYSIVQTTDGGYAVAGYTRSFGAGDYDFLVLKLNSSGGLDWARTFGGTGWDEARSIVQTSDGGYAVAGYARSFGAGGYDLMVLKLNSSGGLDWARTFGGTNYDYAYSITQTTDGGYAVAGKTKSFGAGDYDFLVLKLNSSGGLQWARTFGGTDWDEARSIVQTSDGGYAVAGYAGSFGAGSGDFLVLKLGPDGSYPGCAEDCSPTVGTPSPSASSPSLSTSSPSVGADCSPTVGTPTLTVTDACPPAVEESGVSSGKGITCSPLSGGILFNSPANIGIKIYSVDGRVAYSGELKKGENRIALGQGVYLWIAGQYRGKAAVR